MTDKVQKIREEIERLKSQLLRGACSSQIAMETCCKEEAYNEVLAILDSLQEDPVSEQNLSNVERIEKDWKEESVSEDFEEFEEQYLEKEKDEIISVYDRHAGLVDGAQWQKKQMMKDAIERVVKVDAGGYPYIDGTIELYDYSEDKPLANAGDKVKIIIVKED